MPALVGIDLDGTLIDSAPDLTYALGRALESLALPPPSEAQTRDWIGDGIEVLIVRALTAATGREPDSTTAAKALAAFDVCYGREFFVRSTLYPGVPETLAALRDRGFRIVCITNKRTAFVGPLLAAAGVARHFDAVYGGDSCAAKKPAPDQLIAALDRFGLRPEEAVLVGDSTNDLDAARAAGWRFIYAAYGYTAAMQARGEQPRPRLASFSELVDLLS